MLRPLAKCEPLNTTLNDGAKFVTHVVGVVYVVPSSLPKSSLPFIQYTTSSIFMNSIRLSLAIFAPVVIAVATHASVIVYSFCVQLMLCLTMSLSLVGLLLR